ncbi:hypothetical protein GCM10007301_01280 [Azorhizobium oxalatiphilum]|uniref:Uncharacterized protein n=1 Tax=Azorhizobium oxalatiphilum TaxID=980631 RepID=A0A917BI19_9HYPH|nr:hypothetical protein GCM10007301_01280 [Azorhizobium oxalatiphilum]
MQPSGAKMPLNLSYGRGSGDFQPPRTKGRRGAPALSVCDNPKGQWMTMAEKGQT